MAKLASLWPPSGPAVVAGTAKLAVGDIAHQHLISAGTHLETEFGMARIALVSDAMKPVRKYHRSRALSFRALVKHNITILTGSRRHHSH
jgi:hypothetical protein